MNQPAVCRTCQREDEKRQKELQAELERQARREQEQNEHAAKLAEIERQMRDLREKSADKRAAEENAQALEQKKQDLEAARRLAEQTLNTPLGPKQDKPTVPHIASTSSPAATSTSRCDREQKETLELDQNDAEEKRLACEREWERQKRVDGVSNAAIDAFMALTGLEDVKTKILDIKAKIETVLRQGTDMKEERLGVVLLGNPGTGKIARGTFSTVLITRQNHCRATLRPIPCIGRCTPWE
jgi:DNA repair exonuclease SbcCD ATPase subunit